MRKVSGKAERCLEGVVDLVDVRVNGLDVQCTMEPILEEVLEEEECRQVVDHSAATIRPNVRKLVSERANRIVMPYLNIWYLYNTSQIEANCSEMKNFNERPRSKIAWNTDTFKASTYALGTGTSKRMPINPANGHESKPKGKMTPNQFKQMFFKHNI